MATQTVNPNAQKTRAQLQAEIDALKEQLKAQPVPTEPVTLSPVEGKPGLFILKGGSMKPHFFQAKSIEAIRKSGVFAPSN